VSWLFLCNFSAKVFKSTISSMKNRTIYVVLITLCIIGFWLFENFYTPATYSNTDGSSVDLVESFFLPSSTTGEIVEHNYYTLSYSEPHEQPEWVAYTLKKEYLTYDDRQRPYFIEDPKVRTKSADWRNYRGSGYDRGHFPNRHIMKHFIRVTLAHRINILMQGFGTDWNRRYAIGAKNMAI